MPNRYTPASTLVEYDWDPSTGIATLKFEERVACLGIKTREVMVYEPSGPKHEAWSECYRDKAEVRSIRVGERVVDAATGLGVYL